MRLKTEVNKGAYEGSGVCGKGLEVVKDIITRREIGQKRTRAIAGPKPFHNARTPSLATVFWRQSSIPEYVPVGAAWILDLITYSGIGDFLS